MFLLGLLFIYFKKYSGEYKREDNLVSPRGLRPEDKHLGAAQADSEAEERLRGGQDGVREL